MKCPWLEWMAADGWLSSLQIDQACVLANHADRLQTLAEQLVKNGLITSFQAKYLLAGTENRLDCGRYRIRKLLGRGGMGEVYAAEPRDRRNIPVAIKILELDPNLPDEDRKRSESRFLREMKAGRNVDHANVTKTIDFGRDNDRLYLVMPRLRGPSLAALIEAKNRKPELKTVVRVAIQVNEGLKAIHQAGLVHRDLKPSNIVYDGHKRWKILDLGLAKALGDRQSLTRPGVILGTLDYAAPEQLRDASKVESPADYYALGCILYHALAGHVPFEGGDAVSKIYRHRMTPPEPLASLRPELPHDLCRLVEALLAKNPQDRPTSDLVADRLNLLLAGRTSGSTDDMLLNQDQGSFLATPDMADSEPGNDAEEPPELFPEEELQEIASENWSEPLEAPHARSRLIVNPTRTTPKRFAKSRELELFLSLMLGALLLLSIFFFCRSLLRFVNLFV